jgi:dUTP pyrophosphatase
MKIKFKKIHPNAVLPKQGSEHACGWDVVCTEIIELDKDCVQCKLGWAAEIPIGYKLVLVPRSSFTKYKWIQQNSPGQGDADFRGEYSYVFRAIPTNVYIDLGEDSNGDYYHPRMVAVVDSVRMEYPDSPYKVGERIGQVFIEKVIELEPEWVDELSETVRNEGGFGSTGN